MASSNRISIKATNRSHTTHNRAAAAAAAATKPRDLARQPGRTASALLSRVDSRWAFKAINTGPTMRVTRKETPDTSQLCLLPGVASGMLTEFDSGTPGPQHGYNDAYAQNQAYQASMASGQHQQPPPYDPNAPHQSQQHQVAPQSSDPNAPNYDPNAPPMSEGERGLFGAIGGGVGGHLLGKKAGHGFLGTVGGGILGSLAEDFLKDKNKKHHHSHHSSHGSSWGGSKY
jgi:hypothetical protein